MPQLLTTSYQPTGSELLSGIASAVLGSRRLAQEKAAKDQSMAMELIQGMESQRRFDAQMDLQRQQEERARRQEALPGVTRPKVQSKSGDGGSPADTMIASGAKHGSGLPEAMTIPAGNTLRAMQPPINSVRPAGSTGPGILTSGSVPPVPPVVESSFGETKLSLSPYREGQFNLGGLGEKPAPAAGMLPMQGSTALDDIGGAFGENNTFTPKNTQLMLGPEGKFISVPVLSEDQAKALAKRGYLTPFVDPVTGKVLEPANYGQ